MGCPRIIVFRYSHNISLTEIQMNFAKRGVINKKEKIGHFQLKGGGGSPVIRFFDPVDTFSKRKKRVLEKGGLSVACAGLSFPTITPSSVSR